MMIPDSYINDLLGRVDIIEVIDRRVKLKRSGKNHMACCPFHDEKSPSFSAESVKQMYYCFGCGAGGNAIGFMMDYDGIGFRQAVKSLADSVGLAFEYDGVDPVHTAQSATRQQKEDNMDDTWMVAIYEAAAARGDTIKLSDRKRYQLATNRIIGFDRIYG